MNRCYLLPADDDEMERQALEHRMLQFVFEDGKNYAGPVREVLAPDDEGPTKRVLDLGTGCGTWAIELADEFPHVEVVGVDIVPVQPREVPPNCTFELCDLDRATIPYADASFDFVHARSMRTAIRNYAAFLREIARVLRPRGLVLLVEIDPQPQAEYPEPAPAPVLGKRSRDGSRLPVAAPAAPPTPSVASHPAPHASGTPGWHAIMDVYARALAAQGVEPGVHRRMAAMLRAMDAFDSAKTVALEADLPVGFWPKDPTLLTIAQLMWMDYDILLPALRPYLASLRTADWRMDVLIEDAQRDLYYPVVRLSSRLHVVHAIKAS